MPADDAVNTGATWIEAVLRRLPGLAASDLVLEPQDDGALLALVRCTGVTRRLDRCPPAAAAAAVARLKALARIPAYITTEPQDGRLDGRPYGLPGELRLAVLPTVRGQRLALRLPALGELPKPEGLGLPKAVLARLRHQVRRPDGVVLVTGPTGSGKTTTIHSLLRELAAERPDRQLLTIEDPVERLLPGVSQVEVDHPAGLDFVTVLRSALRQNADVIVVGEIRDADTAATAVQAALSGHLVLATTHVGRCREAVPRLLDMGVDPALLLPGLRAVLTQRLIRLVHPDCAGEGCAACIGGYAGWQVVVDYAEADSGRDWQEPGPTLLADMHDQAGDLVQHRRTDARELERVLG